MVKANCPKMRQPMRSDEDQCGWTQGFSSEGQMLVERMAGWTAPRWPAEYGGGGLSGRGQSSRRDESTGARRPPRSGPDMLGPACRCMPPKSKAQWLISTGKSVVSGRQRTESDLRCPRIKAEDMGITTLINGQVSDSPVRPSRRDLRLVRTILTAPAQASMLFDMASGRKY